MRIVVANTYDIQGGAARAVYRLHQGFLEIGQNTTLLARHKVISDPTVAKIQPTQSDSILNQKAVSLSAIQDAYIDRNRSSLTNTFFSLPYPGYDLSTLSLVQQADILNLHWVAQFQSPVTIRRLLDLGKPLVWTLHDMWAFTGGCHFSAGCSNYQQDCCDCPQLLHDAEQLTHRVLADKLAYLQGSNLTVVTPSQWLADCAKQSQLFKHHRVEVIPNSVETDVFTPLSKKEAKALFSIDPDVSTILFGAIAATEKRKGFAELLQALAVCLENPRFRQLIEAEKVSLLCVGYPDEALNTLAIPVRSLGYISSDEIMSQVYSAADIFVLPSLEDNLPNTMLEAMGCGTPVVAFDVGGIPDLVRDRITGRLVPVGDCRKFAEAILECIFDPAHRLQMGQTCRQVVESDYTLSIQAQRYLELFQELLSQMGRTDTTAPSEISTASTSDNPKASQAAIANSAEDLTISLDCSMGEQFQQVFDQLAFPALANSLHYAQQNISQLQTTLDQAQKHLQNRHQDIEQLRQTQDTLRNQLKQVQEQKIHLKARLKALQLELEQNKTTLTLMQASKFWKLRNQWVKLKTLLRFNSK